MEEDKNIKPGEVNEPASAYVRAGGSTRITFSKSFEEAAEHQYRYWLSLDVESRLALHYKLLVQIHGEPGSLDIKSVRVY